MIRSVRTLVSAAVVAAVFIAGAGAWPGGASVANAAGPCVAGPHTGTISSDQTWCVSDNPHIVSGNVTITSGATVTIEAGVRVEFAGTYEIIVSNGTLNAPGTAVQGIVFTSADPSPEPSDWRGIEYTANGKGTLSYVTVEYAGYFQPAVQVKTSMFSMSNSTVVNNGDTGVQFSSATPITPSLGDTTFTANGFSNGSSAVVQDRQSFPQLSGLTATGNGFDGVEITGDPIIASNYPWGAGIGNYLINSNVTVNAGATLTVLPGTRVAFNSTREILVNGGFNAAGTPSSDIVFTSNDPSPEATDWRGLAFSATAVATLDHVTVEYAGYFQPAVQVATSAFTMTNSVVQNNGQSGVQFSSATPITPSMSDTTFTNNGQGGGYSAVVLDKQSFPLLSGLAATGNGFNGVEITGQPIIASDYSWGSGNANYLISSNVTVNTGATLTVVPGTRVAFASTYEVLFNGALNAVGTAATPIIFTSNEAVPEPSDWKGLTFNASGTGTIDYVTIEFAGYFAPAIQIGSGAVSVTNSTITKSANGILVKAGQPTITNNNFAEITNYSLKDDGNDGVVATCNWWGSPVGPTEGVIDGNVTYNPWLSAPAPGAACTSTPDLGNKVYLPLLGQ